MPPIRAMHLHADKRTVDAGIGPVTFRRTTTLLVDLYKARRSSSGATHLVALPAGSRQSPLLFSRLGLGEDEAPTLVAAGVEAGAEARAGLLSDAIEREITLHGFYVQSLVLEVTLCRLDGRRAFRL